ncbi:phage tail protein [Streptococcus parasanguinis]|uniref:phage tail spike protein n=1 Tax=Streptococcus parasanguinis TaxID=1318 RepID=UPI00352C15A9
MIYLFNNKEELIHIIKEQDLIEFTHKIEINTFDAAEFELPIEAIDKEIIEEMRFFGFFVRGRQFGVFKAYEVTMNDNYVVKGLDRAESDLRTVRIIKDKRLKSVTADQALNVALEGTGYQLGEREGLTKVNKTNFYYISPREALVKIIEAFNCEFRVRYEFVENKIINRYIDLYHRQGSYSGVQFEYGNNALEVTMEEDSDNVVTALIGRGKGEESTDSEGNATGGYGRRIEFTDIVWTKASGKPIDKPAGQNYIVLNDDIENKGLYQNGELKHRWGVFVDEEIEDKEVLLQATYQELLRLNNPIRKYKARILDLRDDTWLGDRVAFVKDSAKLSFEARIFSIMIDKLNFDQSEVELGDYETLKSQSQSSSLNAIKEAVRELSEEQEAYNRKVQELIDNRNAEIAEKMRVMRLDMENGIEDAKNEAEKLKQEISSSVDQKIAEANTTNKNEIKEEFNAKYGDITVEMDQIKSTAELLKSNDKEIKGIIENLNSDFSTQLFNIQGEQARYKTETDKSIADLIKVSDGKADRAYVEQTAKGLKEQFSSFTFSGGPNLIRNSGYKDGLKYFFGTANRFRLGTHPFYYNGSKPIAVIFNDSTNEVLYQTNRFDLERNTDYVLNFRGFNNSSLTSCEVFVLGRKKDETQNYTVIKHLLKPTKLSGQGVEDVSLTFNSGEIDNAYVRFDNNGSSSGQADLYIAEIDLYKGTNKRPWQPAPEDQEYIVTQAQASFERTANGLTQKVTALEASADGLASKIAEYKQTADGQFTTITSQLGDMLKKTDINITDGRISFGTGKSIDGRTISSLLVQEPEAIALIAKLIKVNGDMVVDGSILGRHIASESVETGHMKAGSVTTPILASNSVTADKVLVDSAMINKLVSNQAFIKELMAQKAFITQLASIDFSAERISGGRILSNKGAMKIDLDNSEIDFNENARIEFKSGKNVLFRQRTHPQKKHNTIGALMFKDSVHGGVATTLGNTSHKWINEMTDNSSDAGADGSFAGIRIFRDSRETPYDRVELVGDRIQFRHSVRQNGGLQFQTTGFTIPSHGEGGHAGAWNLGVLLEHFRQNFEIIRKNNPSWGLNIYGFPFYNINSDQTIPFDQYI